MKHSVTNEAERNERFKQQETDRQTEREALSYTHQMQIPSTLLPRLLLKHAFTPKKEKRKKNMKSSVGKILLHHTWIHSLLPLRIKTKASCRSINSSTLSRNSCINSTCVFTFKTKQKRKKNSAESKNQKERERERQTPLKHRIHTMYRIPRIHLVTLLE